MCCGNERENTIQCPLDCEFLLEARKHEVTPAIDPKSIPNADIRVTEDFLHAQSLLVATTGRLLFNAAMETAGAIDLDVREALASIIRTLRTLDSGLIYETRPQNTVAAAVQARFQGLLEEWRKSAAEQTGVHSVRDKDVLGSLVFWERMERGWNNGRRRSRAFLSQLRKASE